jgi:hypothetical protein
MTARTIVEAQSPAGDFSVAEHLLAPKELVTFTGKFVFRSSTAGLGSAAPMTFRGVSGVLLFHTCGADSWVRPGQTCSAS